MAGLKFYKSKSDDKSGTIGAFNYQSKYLILLYFTVSRSLSS